MEPKSLMNNLLKLRHSKEQPCLMGKYVSESSYFAVSSTTHSKELAQNSGTENANLGSPAKKVQDELISDNKVRGTLFKIHT